MTVNKKEAVSRAEIQIKEIISSMFHNSPKIVSQQSSRSYAPEREYLSDFRLIHVRFPDGLFTTPLGSLLFVRKLKPVNKKKE